MRKLYQVLLAFALELADATAGQGQETVTVNGKVNVRVFDDRIALKIG